jgi:predicted metal-dependent hydrolase
LRTKIINSHVNIEGVIIPMEVYREFRIDVRMVMKRDKLIIRIPLHYGKSDINRTIEQTKDWVKTHFNKNSNLKIRYDIKEHKNGDSILINGVEFILEINEYDIINYNARLKNKVIQIKIPIGAEKIERKEALAYLISNIIGQYFLPEVAKRINELNAKYFKVEINEVKMKLNKTNWGSRSTKNNINISTRLLFAPKDVQDYVFIHELAHFFEMNHSKRFWEIVGKIMPDYKEKERWLKINGAKCDF